MAELPTGTTSTTPPPLPGADNKPPAPAPAWWDNPSKVFLITMEIERLRGPAAAAVFWSEYQKLRA